MPEPLSLLFDTTDFPPRWYCGQWTTAHGWTHIISDFAIAGAYGAIPLVIAYFVFRRRDVPFLPVFWLFVAFILFCGIGHLAEAIIFWYPWYRFSALIKACTAIVSWVTVIALLPVIPKALALPHLATINRKLSNYTNELENKNRELDQFAYIASHDLREPLRGLKNLSSWIVADLGEKDLPPDTVRHLSQIGEQIDRMDGLLNGLLEYSRVGRENTTAITVDLAELVNDLIKLFDRPSSMQIMVSQPMPTLVTQKAPLETCLRNLIANAIRHHDRADGTIRISAEETSGGFVDMTIEDDGPGIAPEHHARVFEIFQRLRPRESAGGCGMGLALVKKIAETHRGGITLESRQGEGSKFTLRWPLDASDKDSNRFPEMTP